MKRRIRLRKKIHVKSNMKEKLFHGKKSNIVITIIVLLVFAIILSFYYINKRVTPILMKYGEIEIRKLSTLIISKAISKQVTEELDVNELFVIEKDNNGEINTIDFNPVIVNKILSVTTNTVQLNLRYIEEGKIHLLDIPDGVLAGYDEKKLKKGIIYEIPSGIIFQNSMLSNLGPKIPVRLNLYGDISTDIHTKITNYGINNAMIEASVTVIVNEQIILPFSTKLITMKANIPIAMKLIRGNIPSYYFNGIDKNSSSLIVPAK